MDFIRGSFTNRNKMIAKRLSETIRNIPDFPKPGIQFKDITPVLADPALSLDVTQAFYDYWHNKGVDAVVGIESRGFIYGTSLAQKLGVPFIPVRKVGRLPFRTIKYKYDLEYGFAEMEMHIDALKEGQNVLIHDDLLATGGTAAAAAELVRMCKSNVVGFSFLVELGFLNGTDKLKPYSHAVHSLISY